MRKTFMYRIYPNKSQISSLESQLRSACNLYNAALEERRSAYRKNGISLNYYSQANQLKEIRLEGLIDVANYGCCQDVLRRLDKAYQAFFRRVKRGEKAGFPRFKPHQRFDSITFPAYGNGIKLLPVNRLRIQGVGLVKIKLHRELEGNVKTVTIKRDAGKWYACFSVELPDILLDYNENAVGIDVGLESFAMMSSGEVIQNPRYHKEAQKKLRRCQRKVSRRKKGSKSRKKAVILLQKAHAHVRNQRKDFHHKLAHQIVRDYGVIAIEDLNVKSLARGWLSKSVHDVGWSSFFGILSYKAENAGRQLVKVDPRGTSQRCCKCQTEVRKELSQRWHHCPSCNLSIPRDLNSAYEILRLGLSLDGLTWSNSSCVPLEAIVLKQW